MKARVHPLQTQRLAALRSYDILDTPRERDFDDLVALAAAICETPISVVNLIDADRQWFKAEVGLGVRETPLDTSICSHAILERDLIEIPDTRRDDRMVGNELVTGEPGLRFYAGALLETADGLPLGTLCVLDYQPRQLNDIQRLTLRVLARQVMTQLDLRKALRVQTVIMDEMDHRVKNPLQSVSSLVRMQRGRSTDTGVRAALEEVGQRLNIISLVHEELGRAGGSDRVDLGQYVERLVALLQANAPEHVRYTASVQPILAESRQASSIGMIVSEFAANSLKHAFPGNRPGSVRVTLKLVGEGAAELICEDDGVGVSATGAGAPSTGLGLRIMDASTAQLDGKVDPDPPEAGVRLRVTFPLGRARAGQKTGKAADVPPP